MNSTTDTDGASPSGEYFEPDQLQPVVTTLLLLNVAAYLVTENAPQRFVWLLWPPNTPLFAWWQVVTHQFMHAHLLHLGLNLMTLYCIGPIMEASLLRLRFLILYLSAGLMAACGHLGYQMVTRPDDTLPMLGASGAVYGVVAGFAALYPNFKLRPMFLPFAFPAWLLVGAFISVDLALGLSGRSTGVAHFAHLGGGLAGLLMVLIWRFTHQIPYVFVEEEVDA